MYRGRREFRYGLVIVFVSIASAILFIGLAVWTYRTYGWTWMSLGAFGLAALGIAGVAEILVTRVELTGDALVITGLRGTRRYARTGIKRVEEARGVSPAVLLEDGRWVQLPPVGTRIGNTRRAWLKNAGGD
jgi:hypothetical protein